jgi:hypothetical protein
MTVKRRSILRNYTIEEKERRIPTFLLIKHPTHRRFLRVEGESDLHTICLQFEFNCIIMNETNIYELCEIKLYRRSVKIEAVGSKN